MRFESRFLAFQFTTLCSINVSRRVHIVLVISWFVLVVSLAWYSMTCSLLFLYRLFPYALLFVVSLPYLWFIVNIP